MRRLSSLSFRNMFSRKLRTVITSFGIVLGVATVLAFGVMNATVENSLDDFFSQTAGDADLTVSSSERGQTFRERALRQVEDYPDTVLAVGSLWKGGTLRLPDEDEAISLVGIDPDTDPYVRSYKLAEGRMVSNVDRTYTLVLVSTYAEDNDIILGDEIEIELEEGRVETFEVVGLLKDEGAARTNNGAIGFMRLDVGQDLFDERGRLSQIDLVVSPEIATDSKALEQLKDDLAEQIGDDYTVAYPGAVGQAIVDSMAGLRSGLGIFSTIALFVGAMLIYNTFSMTIAERTAEIGMLRAVGATRSQVLRLVLVEAGLMGFFGSVAGLGLGIFFAIPMVQMFAGAFGGIPLDRFTVPPASVVQAVLVGVIVTVLAALIPAWRAGRISPVEAMRARAESQKGFFARNGWKVGLVLMAFSLSDIFVNLLATPILWLAPSLENGDLAAFRRGISSVLVMVGLFTMAPRFWTTAIRWVGRRWPGLIRRFDRWTSNRYFEFFAEGGWLIGLMLLTQGVANLTPIWDHLPDAAFFMFTFTGGTLVLPIVIQLLERGARSVLSFIYGPSGGLGSRNLNRALGRTSLTVGVLMVGATLTIAIGSMQAAFDDAINDWVDNLLGGDLTVESERGQRVEFTNQLMTVPGVELATHFSIEGVELTGVTNGQGFSSADDSLAFQAVDLPDYRQVAGFQFAEDAELEDEILARLARGDAVLISGVLSDEYEVHRGDSIRLRTRRGERDFEVAGVVNDFMWGGKSFIGLWSDLGQYFGINRVWLFLVKLSPDADADAVKQTIETRLSRFGDFEVAKATEFRENISRDVRSFMGIFSVVVYIAVMVAGLGVINTMMMNILERMREIGMLRSIGMTRGQIARMVFAEAAAMGVIGAAFGLGLGWLIAEDMVVGMGSGTGWDFEYIFPAVAFASAAITALVVSQLASVYPVWRAGRVRIVEAIQHE